jgi:hypothetical protein
MNSYRLLETVWTLTIVLVVALIVYGITGCAPVQCLKPVVTAPALPELPRVSASQLQCLTDQTYRDLVLREVTIREAYEQCLVILEEVTE